MILPKPGCVLLLPTHARVVPWCSYVMRRATPPQWFAGSFWVLCVSSTDRGRSSASTHAYSSPMKLLSFLFCVICSGSTAVSIGMRSTSAPFCRSPAARSAPIGTARSPDATLERSLTSASDVVPTRSPLPPSCALEASFVAALSLHAIHAFPTRNRSAMRAFSIIPHHRSFREKLGSRCGIYTCACSENCALSRARIFVSPSTGT